MQSSPCPSDRVIFFQIISLSDIFISPLEDMYVSWCLVKGCQTDDFVRLQLLCH